MYDLSIVIPAWNRSALLNRLLESLFAARKAYKYGDTEVRMRSGKIVSAYDIEQLLYLHGHCGAYYVGECADGSYCLHVPNEIRDRTDGDGLMIGMSGLMEAACRIRYDCPNTYEYKNHCFRPE